eukprot:2549143-Rhodomonas_salina.2
MQCPVLRYRMCYAVSGTDRAYAYVLCGVRTERKCVLCGVRYGATVCCFALATRCPVLRYAFAAARREEDTRIEEGGGGVVKVASPYRPTRFLCHVRY